MRRTFCATSDDLWLIITDLLAERGLDAAERQRLTGLVKLAKTASKVEPPNEAEQEVNEKQYLENLRALRAWYEEWGGVARVAIKRRDHLILLGLAQRRSPTKSDDDSDDDGGASLRARGSRGPQCKLRLTSPSGLVPSLGPWRTAFVEYAFRMGSTNLISLAIHGQRRLPRCPGDPEF